MNFPLEVNEQLAKAIRTAVAFKIEVEKINGIASKKEIVNTRQAHQTSQVTSLKEVYLS